MHLFALDGSLRVFVCSLRGLRVPDLFGLTSVVQKEEDIGVLTDAVVSKALQIDEEVVRHGDTATVTMALPGAVTLGTKKKVTVSVLAATLYIDSLFIRSMGGGYCTGLIMY